MKALPRLTPESLKIAERAGKAEGWRKLLMQGYLPAEIAVHARPVVVPSDVVTRVRTYARTKNLPLPVSCAPKKEIADPEPVADWRAAFRASTMRTGMQLSLTQPMLEFLCAVADDVLWDRTGESTQAKPACCFVTGRCLEKRGLVERKCRDELKRRFDQRDHDSAYYRLTEAGLAVVALLKSVGVFVPADRAIQKSGGKS